MISLRTISIRVGLAGALLGAAAALAAPGVEPLTAATALRLAISELTQEGETAERDGDLAHRHADFASRFPHGDVIHVERLWRALATPAHHQPFIDAYVRWQLTSLVPESAPKIEISRREFERILEKLPSVVVNPRADEAMIVLLRDAAETGPLSEADQAKVEELMSELARRSGRAEALAKPALGLQEWWQRRFENDAARSLHVRIERCAALAQAGWSVDELKASLDDAFATAARDREVDADERAAIAARAAKLIGHRRMFLESATIVEGSLYLSLREAAVYDFDVTRWTRELRGE